MKQLLSVAVGLLLIVFACSAQSSKFAADSYISPRGDTLPYRLLVPDSDTFRRYPLVIFLHGSGERGNDNEAQLKWGALNFATDENMFRFPAFVVAPQCPAGQGWANLDRDRTSNRISLLPTPSKPMTSLLELIAKLKKSLRIDTTRIYITGLSMGGFGTYDALMRVPGMFAAAVPVCGGGDISKAGTIARIPLWIFHGAEDPAVSPVFSYEMVDALTKAGARPGFTMYPEVGHFSWLGAYSDPQMITWLFRQRKQ
jgi:predicted peptidase